MSQRDSSDNSYYYLNNYHGDVVGLSDINGDIVNSYSYDAFGNTLEANEQVNNRFRYSGEQFDSITNQYYLRARFYNPVVGRFTQEDEYRGDGLNLYAYVDNNPINYVDPSGYALTCERKIELYKEYPNLYENKKAREASNYRNSDVRLNSKERSTTRDQWKEQQRRERIDRRENMYPSTYKERIDKTPDSGGRWTGPRGESKFIPSDPKMKDMLDKYGLDGIRYRNGIPDFSQVAWGRNVQIEGMRGGITKSEQTKARNYNYGKAYEQLSKETNMSVKELESIRKDFNLTWHELNDRKTMQLVPREINGFFKHIGGVSETSTLMKVFGLTYEDFLR